MLDFFFDVYYNVEMNVKNFVSCFTEQLGCDFFAGVPDSQLKEFCDYIYDKFELGKSHFICANEGNATALAAGAYLASGKIPVVYLQNSGIGNLVNPISSLHNDKVYGIPCVYVVGWRGEPGIKDEPQHLFQGIITLEQLRILDIATIVVDKLTTEEELIKAMAAHKEFLNSGKSIAFIVKKETFSSDTNVEYFNKNILNRESIIEAVVDVCGDDLVVCTTGKASRELFEIRERKNMSHKYDFLTVGSMGHSSSIALGIALKKPSTKVWCIDGDGAAIMHMGAMATIGAASPDNLVHIVINNEAHETVGGMPTVASKICFKKIANGCGYPNVLFADDKVTLNSALKKATKSNSLTFIEIKAALGARENLGRPTTTVKENKHTFVRYVKGLN